MDGAEARRERPAPLLNWREGAIERLPCERAIGGEIAAIRGEDFRAWREVGKGNDAGIRKSQAVERIIFSTKAAGIERGALCRIQRAGHRPQALSGAVPMR